MSRAFHPAGPLKKKRSFFTLFLLLFCCRPPLVQGIELDPYPVERFSREDFSFSIYREERPSFYWVNTGLPDFFFNGVSQLSGLGGGVVSFSVRSIEYGFRLGAWLDPRFQLRATLPFEANALEDPANVTHGLQKFGDLEIASTYLLLGDKEKGNFIGVDGWARLATGTKPFTQAYPFLSTGKGASSAALGLVMRQEAYGFSLFGSIHYENTELLSLDSSSIVGTGSFQWPETLQASGRIEYLLFHRAQRFITLFYELRMRMTGAMSLNGQPLTYGTGQLNDMLFFSTGGMVVQVDKDLSVEGHATYFPFELGRARPDFGLLFSASVGYRIF